jgi:hypothetical protein
LFNNFRAVSRQIHRWRKKSNVDKKLKVAKRKLVTNINKSNLLRKVLICATQKWRKRILVQWEHCVYHSRCTGNMFTCSLAHVLSVLECKNNAREQQEQGFQIHTSSPNAYPVHPNWYGISFTWVEASAGGL